MFHTDNTKALIEWPFPIANDRAYIWRDRPYAQRMAFIKSYVKFNWNLLH